MNHKGQKSHEEVRYPLLSDLTYQANEGFPCGSSTE